MNIRNDKTFWLLIFISFISLCSDAYVSDFNATLYVGSEWGNLRDKQLAGVGGLAGGDIRLKKNNTYWGIGAEYMIPREGFREPFNFIPVYGLLAYNVDILKSKFIAKTGYTFYIREDISGYTEEDYHYNYQYTGGLYYSLGIDRALMKNTFMGLHYSVCNGIRSSMGIDADDRYKKLEIVVGIMLK